MRELVVAPRFEKDMEAVPYEIKMRGDIIIQRLLENPLDSSLNIRKLKGLSPATFRVRIGSYRLVYQFTKTKLILLRLRNRKDIYGGL
jgi:mRNA-degrading endonuclease RelE of RelBE toxin-antitoxin system